MNELVTDIKKLQEETLKNLKNEANASYHKIPKKFDWDDILSVFKSMFTRKNK